MNNSQKGSSFPNNGMGIMMRSGTVAVSILLFSIGILTAQQTIGLFLRDTAAYDGYVLFSPNMTTYLVDNCGKEVHTWQHDSRPGLTAYLLEDGDLLRAGQVTEGIGAGSGGLIQRYSWDGELEWSFEVNDSTAFQHHDIEPMPNGNILVVAWEVKSVEEGVQAGADADRGYWSFVILELEPHGNDSAAIVWEWHLWDHLVQDHDLTKDNYGVVADHPELLDINFSPPTNNGDWIHVNSIDYNPTRDEILVSARHTSEIYIIDHSTTTEEAAGHSGGDRGKGGDILYRWGNPMAYNSGDAADRILYRQHDAQWIPSGYPDEGMISIFNNGTGRLDGNYSSVDIIDPPINESGNYIRSSDSPYGPIGINWRYFADPRTEFFSQNMGGAHLLPNGHALITESISGRLFEVDRSGKLIWQYVNPTNNFGAIQQGSFGNTSVFRATKYSKDFSGLNGKDLTPGEPIEINPIDYECPAIISSVKEPLIFENVQIFQNPIHDQLVIKIDHSMDMTAWIYNYQGQLLRRHSLFQGENQLEFNNYAPGVYLVRITKGKSISEKTYRIIKL